MIIPKYQNILHLLAMENKPEDLHTILSQEPDITKYFPITGSPIISATPQCGNILIGYLTDQQTNACHLINHFSQKSILRILALPQQSSYEVLQQLAPENERLSKIMRDQQEKMELRHDPISFWECKNIDQIYQ